MNFSHSLKYLRIQKITTLLSIVLVSTGLMFMANSASAKEDLSVVPFVELNKYLGKWHEIARIDHSFQKGCKNSIAEYSMRSDGDIKVVNSCDITGNDKRKQAVGRAWVTEPTTNSKLRVQFFLTGFKIGFLSGQYWIIALDPNYKYVMVGEPSREYLWILARTPDLPEIVLKNLLIKAEELGFDTEKLLFNKGLGP